MGYFRFWRRMKLAPGVYVNLSKSGPSLSVGPRGAKYTVGARGRRVTAGIPGTGLFYTTQLSKGAGRKERASSAPAAPRVRAEDRLTMGFFKRLVTPEDEQGFVDGCRELALGSDDQAFTHLKGALHLADAAFLAGLLALGRGRLKEAEKYLSIAAENHRSLGRYFSRYGISPATELPITDEITVHPASNLRGVLITLVEVYQRGENWGKALAVLERLRRLEPESVLVKLSLAELLLASKPGDRDVCRRIVRLAEGVENTVAVATALLLYKARALRVLGLSDAAKDTLTLALRRKKDRPDHLMKALRYERALVYEELGSRRRARADFERLYAEDPDYADVAGRLGL